MVERESEKSRHEPRIKSGGGKLYWGNGVENEREAGVLLDKKKREKQPGKRQSGSPAGQGENSGTEMRYLHIFRYFPNNNGTQVSYLSVAGSETAKCPEIAHRSSSMRDSGRSKRGIAYLSSSILNFGFLQMEKGRISVPLLDNLILPKGIARSIFLDRESGLFIKRGWRISVSL